ncbi:hypothetical protein [Nannocystis pusilla]|uniref:Uncharacterized protein n=1 Tax=Nannocystis pusilla TaxID=889268 RepID=A0ABS7TKT6_9BACT|nr:hypothetical protein [Nannocystis pusilla]MBZ5708832.1 hypothetical protein [Nannocystis pusilla]
MRQLLRELAETIEDDEEDADGEGPSGRGQYDVRGFDPGKKAIPLNSDPSGDLYFRATAAKSGAETRRLAVARGLGRRSSDRVSGPSCGK